MYHIKIGNEYDIIPGKFEMPDIRKMRRSFEEQLRKYLLKLEQNGEHDTSRLVLNRLEMELHRLEMELHKQIGEYSK